MGELSVVIPAGGKERLDLLGATLAGLRRCPGVAQVIVSECGTHPFALAAARAHGADHLFTSFGGRFSRARACNAGCRLARHGAILFCDGDMLFDEGFPARALREFEASGADYFFPHSALHGLDEVSTRDIVAGRRRPQDCTPAATHRPVRVPGGLGLVRADFLARHGGFVDGFMGWGFEDGAWVHKVSVLGRVAHTQRTDQDAYHLFHWDSGSYSEAGYLRQKSLNPDFERNVALFNEVSAIQAPDVFALRFPPPAFEPPPFPTDTSAAFAVAGSPSSGCTRLATSWAERLAQVYGPRIAAVSPAGTTSDAEAVAGFADDDEGFGVLARAGRLDVLVPGEGVTPSAATDAWVLARDPAARDRWEQAGARVWHRPWQDGAAGNGQVAPVIAQPLSWVLGVAKRWRVRITLDRASLPPVATDRPAFWYVALKDRAGDVLLRCDAERAELHRVLRQVDEPVVLEREVRGNRRPATWVVQPMDRRRNWLDPLSGTADAWWAAVD